MTRPIADIFVFPVGSLGQMFMVRADALDNGLFGFLRKSSTCNQPWQIAAAVVLGCASGLLPKANLLFPLFLAVLYTLRVHLPVAGLTMLGCSLIAPLMHPFQGDLGAWLFQFEGFTRLIHRLDRIAIVPWLRLHNTVVVGSLSMSAALAIPFYLLMHRILLIHHTHWMASQTRLSFELAMFKKKEAMNSLPAPMNSLKVSKFESQRPTVVEPTVEPKPLAEPQPTSLRQATTAACAQPQSPKPVTASIDSVHALETLLEQAAGEQSAGIDTAAILARATKAAALVDDIIHSLESELIQRVDKDHQVETYRAHDTTISLSRSTHSPAANEPMAMPRTNNTIFPKKDSMIRNSHSPIVSLPVPKQRVGTIGDSDSVTQAHETATRNVEIRHEESLRHLLNHLRRINEEVK